MSNSINVEHLVSAYRALRDEKDRITAIFENEENALKEAMNRVSEALLSLCNEMGVDSLKTQEGTVIRTLKERYYTNDWEGFKQFALEHQALDLFEKRIHQGNMKEWMSNHPDDGLPPGTNVAREYQVQVRKPVGK